MVGEADGPYAILVAVDASDTSYRASAYAAGLARRQHARLICLYVRTGSGLAGMSPALAGPLSEAQESMAEEIRETVAASAARLGLDLTFLEAVGNPAAEIARVADELRVDAVVVGASMHAGHRFVGSIATALVRGARWPVTVVP